MVSGLAPCGTQHRCSRADEGFCLQAPAVWGGALPAGLLTLDAEGALLQWPSMPPAGVHGPGWVLPRHAWTLRPAVEVWQPA